MTQIAFPFDDSPPNPPELEMDAELERHLIESMAQAIVSVFQSIEGREHDPA